jgi:hypothetical protein
MMRSKITKENWSSSKDGSSKKTGQSRAGQRKRRRQKVQNVIMRKK